MRLCAHVRLSIGIGKHHRRNGVLKGTYLTPDGMLVNIAYTTKRKHKCSSSFLKFADFIDKDSITMLFLLTTFALESRCKDTNISRYGKINLRFMV